MNLGNVFYENIKSKNILFYFEDEELQDISDKLNYNGEIKSTKGDYLMMVDSDFGDPNPKVKQQIVYNIFEENDQLLVSLDINFANIEDLEFDSYFRIYSPIGTVFKSSNVDNRIDIYDENDKNIFGFFVKIAPNEMKNIHFEYYLPKRIKDLIKIGEYSLYVQKQPGLDIEKITVDLNFINGIRLYKPTGFFVEFDKNYVKWEKSLKTDLEFVINF